MCKWSNHNYKCFLTTPSYRLASKFPVQKYPILQQTNQKQTIHQIHPEGVKISRRKKHLCWTEKFLPENGYSKLLLAYAWMSFVIWLCVIGLPHVATTCVLRSRVVEKWKETYVNKHNGIHRNSSSACSPAPQPSQSSQWFRKRMTWIQPETSAHEHQDWKKKKRKHNYYMRCSEESQHMYELIK